MNLKGNNFIKCFTAIKIHNSEKGQSKILIKRSFWLLSSIDICSIFEASFILFIFLGKKKQPSTDSSEDISEDSSDSMDEEEEEEDEEESGINELEDNLESKDLCIEIKIAKDEVHIRKLKWNKGNLEILG